MSLGLKAYLIQSVNRIMVERFLPFEDELIDWWMKLRLIHYCEDNREEMAKLGRNYVLIFDALEEEFGKMGIEPEQIEEAIDKHIEQMEMIKENIDFTQSIYYAYYAPQLPDYSSTPFEPLPDLPPPPALNRSKKVQVIDSEEGCCAWLFRRRP